MVSLRGCPKCTGSGPVKHSVNYFAIADAFTERGMFAPDMRALKNEWERVARVFSPKRTRRLERAHYSVILPPRGYTRSIFVGNRMGYAKFPAFGTKGNGTGYISAHPPGMLELRPVPYSYFKASDPRRFQAAVRGQKEQGNWIYDAGKEVTNAFLRNGRRRS